MSDPLAQYRRQQGPMRPRIEPIGWQRGTVWIVLSTDVTRGVTEPIGPFGNKRDARAWADEMAAYNRAWRYEVKLMRSAPKSASPSEGEQT